jgi:type II secretory pathway pseudopilin PulG
MFMKFLVGKKQKILGLTLLELVVAVSLFAILILVATKTFTKITDIQNRTKDEQNIEGDLRYAMGVFVDEVRVASKHPTGESTCAADGTCVGKYYCTSADNITLYLRDTNNLCVTYTLTNGQLVVSRNGTNYTITSDDVTVDSLQFLPSALSDRILIKLKASGASDYNKSISYQTAITSTALR